MDYEAFHTNASQERLISVEKSVQLISSLSSVYFFKTKPKSGRKMFSLSPVSPGGKDPFWFPVKFYFFQGKGKVIHTHRSPHPRFYSTKWLVGPGFHEPSSFFPGCAKCRKSLGR